MIKELNLTNFKSFRHQNVVLSNLNILTGINGTGKSTIIQSILMIMQSEHDRYIESNGSLVELGDYSDIHYENAEDDSFIIELLGVDSKSSWGYNGKEEVPASTDKFPALEGDTEILSLIRTKCIYISAERWGPRANLPLKSYNSNPFWLGKHGEFTIQFLHALNAGSLRDQEGYSRSTLPADDPRCHDSSVGSLIFANIIAWMGEISPNVTINASVIKEAMTGYSSFSFDSGKKHKAINVGFGLSYSLSVVTALVSAVKDSLVIIENPEAHLHPSGQSKLGQLISLASIAGVQVLVETHSEHVINGSRIMIRKGRVPANELNVMYVDKVEDGDESYIKFISANDMGQLSEWPDGFFDQQAKDMKTLMTGV